MRRSIETIVDVCRSMRMIHTVPASFDGLRDLWDRMSDELDSVQEYRKAHQYRSLFFASVRESISETSYNQFFTQAVITTDRYERSHHLETDDERFRNYRQVVAEIAKSLHDSGANSTLSYRSIASVTSSPHTNPMVDEIYEEDEEYYHCEEVPEKDKEYYHEKEISEEVGLIALCAALVYEKPWAVLNSVFQKQIDDHERRTGLPFGTPTLNAMRKLVRGICDDASRRVVLLKYVCPELPRGLIIIPYCDRNETCRKCGTKGHKESICSCQLCGMKGHGESTCFKGHFKNPGKVGESRWFLSLPVLARMRVAGKQTRLNQVLEIAFTSGILSVLKDLPDAGLYLKTLNDMIIEKEAMVFPIKGSNISGRDRQTKSGGGRSPRGSNSIYHRHRRESSSLSTGSTVHLSPKSYSMKQMSKPKHSSPGTRCELVDPPSVRAKHGSSSLRATASVSVIQPTKETATSVVSALADSMAAKSGPKITVTPKVEILRRITGQQRARCLSPKHRILMSSSGSPISESNRASTTMANINLAVRQAYNSAEDVFFKTYGEELIEGKRDVTMAIPEWKVAMGDRSVLDCVELGTVDNRYIRYIIGEMSAVTQDEEILCFFDKVEKEMERRRIPMKEIQTALAGTHSIEQSGRGISSLDAGASVTSGNNARKLVLIDEGAAITCVSGDLVRSLGLKVRYDKRGLILAGFQKKKHRSLADMRDGVKYVVMILAINGVRGSVDVTQRILVVALVVEGLSCPMLLGGNLIQRHAIRDDDDWDDHLSMFRGTKRMLVPKLRGDIVDRMTSTTFEDGTMLLFRMNYEGVRELWGPLSDKPNPPWDPPRKPPDKGRSTEGEVLDPP